MLWLEKLTARFGGYEQTILLGVLVCLGVLVLSVVGKCGYAFWRYGVALSRGKKERHLQRADRGNRLEYALPARENTLVRERLLSALSTDKREQGDVDAESVGVKLQYATKLIARLKENALTAVEGLEVKEMSALVALYNRKEKWTNEDVKALGEVLARLLKLTAKYDVAL